MSFTAFILILLSTVLHALWHFINKTGRPTPAYYSMFSLSCLISLTPFMLFSGIPLSSIPLNVAGYCFLGGFFGIFCNFGLVLAYRTVDMSVAYPLTRALPVIFTMILTAVFGIGKTLTVWIWLAMFCIFIGCLITGFSVQKQLSIHAFMKRGMFGVLIAALGTTGYTIIDNCGIHAITEAMPDVNGFFTAAMYSWIREFSALAIITAISLSQKKLRAGYEKRMFCSWHAYVAGLIASIAYLLVLISNRYVTNVSYVQAFRQMSLPVGVLLGWLILKEKISRTRLIGLVVILGGLLALAVLK